MAAGFFIVLNIECVWDSVVLQLPSSRGPAFRVGGSGKKLLHRGARFGSRVFTTGHYRVGTCRLRAGDTMQEAMHYLLTERLKYINFLLISIY